MGHCEVGCTLNTQPVGRSPWKVAMCAHISTRAAKFVHGDAVSPSEVGRYAIFLKLCVYLHCLT